jgi:monothiol glutaredoxin
MNLDENIKNQIEQLIQENDVFLFMKGKPDLPMCGFS